MPKEKLIHTQSHVGRLLRAANDAQLRIAEIVFEPSGVIRMVPEKQGNQPPPVSETEIEPPAAA